MESPHQTDHKISRSRTRFDINRYININIKPKQIKSRLETRCFWFDCGVSRMWQLGAIPWVAARVEYVPVGGQSEVGG